jgi:FtsP/CotA-like multicopper oxidase with cupredoxin domain
MKVAAGAALCLLLSVVSARAAAGELVDPPTLRSANGRLLVQLSAAPAPIIIGEHRFDGMLYNGAYIPELWRVGPGDELVVRLSNKLPEITNLHFHGMKVSPQGASDNVFVHIQPGESLTYRVDIPLEHPPGLFWYHSHAHGLSSQQIIGGLSGALIVEGSERLYPFLRDLKERVLLLKHHPDPRADWEELVTLNGMVAPIIPIRPGELQYWRIGNIGADLFLKLKLEGIALYLIGTDGTYLHRPVKVDEMMLGPGQRIEVVAVGGPPGSYHLKSIPFILESGRPPLPEHELGIVVSDGPAADITAAEAKVVAQAVEVSRYIEALRASPIARRRIFSFSRSEDRSKFFINAELFDPNRTDVTAVLGDVEEWTVRNEDNQLHNFHIHQTEFLVTSVNGERQNLDSLYDTFTVPAAEEGRPGEIKVVIPFTNPAIVGRFVFHCHVVKHEDKGMMQTIEVVRRSE